MSNQLLMVLLHQQEPKIRSVEEIGVGFNSMTNISIDFFFELTIDVIERS